MKTLWEHNLQVRRIAKEIGRYSSSDKTTKLRFYHGDSNSTRTSKENNYCWINISDLNEVIKVDKNPSYALIEPNVPMDKLVEETLKFGLVPKVVMEFPGITCGGAINGATLESSSFKYGQFNDNCIEYEIILGNGQVIKASEKKNKEIFHGISGTYGTLGLITLIKVSLIPASKYIKTKFYPIRSWGKILTFIKNKINKSDVDFIEGIIFDSNSGTVITGKFADIVNSPIITYSKASDQWFYKRAKESLKNDCIHEELIPIKDYLFRYNRGAFWMGEYVFPLLHIPNNIITKYLLNPFLNTRKLHDGLVALNIGQYYFVQDFYCRFNKTIGLLKYSNKRLSIYPIWLCPIKPARNMQKMSPHYIKDKMLIDIGIWGQTDKYLKDPIKVNKDFEEFAKNNARKMLYAHAYYEENEFWDIYDKKWYFQLRKNYKADSVFPNIWQKIRVSKKYKINKWKGVLKILKETIRGKNINA
jgi:Delta24-sterol reductase